MILSSSSALYARYRAPNLTDPGYMRKLRDEWQDSKALAGQSVYLDTNIIIYLLEGFKSHEAALLRLLTAIEDGEIQCVTSQMTVAEVLVRPFKDGATEQIKTYLDALNDPRLLSLMSVSVQTFVDAAFMRAETSMKLPDAIHVAAASQAGCDVFLTNDKKIKTPKSMRLMGLADL